jgi:hypothetical protein
LEQVIKKYDIQWIIFDSSFIPDITAKYSFYIENTDQLLHNSTMLTPVQNFPVRNTQNDSITLYKVKQNIPMKSSIALWNNLPIDGSPYQWTQIDNAYTLFGPYQSSQSVEQESSFFFPFRTLFTNRKVEERTFNIIEKTDRFIFDTVIPHSVSGQTLVVPPYTIDSLNQIQQNQRSLVGSDMYLDGNLLASFRTEASESGKFIVPPFINGIFEYSFPKVWGESSFNNHAQKLDTMNIKRCDNKESGTIHYSTIGQFPEQTYHMETTDSSVCGDIFIPSLVQKNGYLLTVDTKNLTGSPLTLYLINATTQRTDMTLLLPNTENLPDWSVQYIFIPPMQTDGLGYSFRFANASLGPTSINEFRNLRINPMPYTFLTQLLIQKPKGVEPGVPMGNFTVNHPNPSYYSITTPSSILGDTTLTLSEAFDPGWKGYEVSCGLWVVGCEIQKGLPFLFGKPLSNHVLINNWANGWSLESTLRQAQGTATDPSTPLRASNSQLTTYNSQSTTIILFFLPQLLEWVGFALLPIPFLFLIIFHHRHLSSTAHQ